MRPLPNVSSPRQPIKIFTHQDPSKLVACQYCRKTFHTLGGQARHVTQTDCRLREQATLAAARFKRRLEESSHGRAVKQVRFTHGDVTFVAELVKDTSETASPPPDEGLTTEQASQPPLEPSTSDTNPEPSSRKRLVTYDGGRTYVKHYPDPRAGSPIKNSIAPDFDLHAYIQSTGTLSNPHNFDTLELFMTTGLTDEGRDRFLKSRAVSILFQTITNSGTYINCMQVQGQNTMAELRKDA